MREGSTAKKAHQSRMRRKDLQMTVSRRCEVEVVSDRDLSVCVPARGSTAAAGQGHFTGNSRERRCEGEAKCRGCEEGCRTRIFVVWPSVGESRNERGWWLSSVSAEATRRRVGLMEGWTALDTVRACPGGAWLDYCPRPLGSTVAGRGRRREQRHRHTLPFSRRGKRHDCLGLGLASLMGLSGRAASEAS